MADVFISYHEESAGELVKQIVDMLESKNISCWYMGRDSQEGTFARKITQGIYSCRMFLLILNEKSNRSEHVQNEVGLAFRCFKEYKRIKILPYIIDNCTLSEDMLYYLNRFTMRKGNPDDERFIPKLVDQIIGILGAESPTVPSMKRKQPTDIIKDGSCGDTARYTLNANGVMFISGRGKMRKFGLTALAPWWNERETILFVHIQNGIISIGDSAFVGCVNLSSVIIPECVTSIGWAAFQGCESLTNITIPASVVYIDGGAFQNCTSLTSVNIPDSVTSIGNWAFGGCQSLTDVNIPDSVTYIGVGAFDSCINLADVSVPANATIDYEAFPENTNVTLRIKRK